MKYRDVEKCIKEFSMTVVDSDDVKIRLKAAFDGLIKSIDKHGDYSLKDSRVLIDKMCNGILDIMDLLNNNRRQEAHRKLFDLYFKDSNSERLRLCTVNADTCFYKMRSAEKFTQYLKDEGEAGMYHVPFEQRYKIGNDRYGITGFPVFYLSSSSYGCWEELKRPNLEFTNVALFKSTQNMLFIDMVLPSNEETINKKFMMSLPLILASRLKVKHPEGNYIQEYSIPQLVMECLIDNRTEVVVDDTIIGVRYESIRRNDVGLLFTDIDEDNIFVNYAIPPFKTMEKGICPEIMKLFYLWNSVSWAEITYKHPSWCVDVDNKVKTHYQESKFGIIEKYLCERDRGMLTYHTRQKGGIPVGALTI